MIKVKLIIFLLCFGFFVTKGQDKFSLGAGVNYSSVSSINSANPDGIIGLNVIAAYKFYMNDLGWFLKPSLSYSQEGWLLQRLDFINVPLVVGFDFTDDFNLNLGFQYGYLIGGLNDLENAIDRNNMAFLIGFEFYPAPKFDVGLRFASGIKNIIKESGGAQPIQDARTYSIQLYFSYNLFVKNN